MNLFHAGFADELTKEAGVRDVVKRILHGKPLPKIGFFERRRIAKALGVKPKDVERTLMERQKRDRLTQAGFAGGGLALGAVAGSSMGKQADGYGRIARGSTKQADGGYTPDQQAMMKRRDDLMRQRGVKVPNNDYSKPPPKIDPLIARRDALMKTRKPIAPGNGQQDLLARRDALMKSRQKLPGQAAAVAKPPKPAGSALAGSMYGAFGR